MTLSLPDNFVRWSGTILIAAALAVGCTPKKAASFQSPEFTLKDLSGNVVKLSSFRGHVVLLDFWATWCGPCRISTPEVKRFYERHRADGLVVLSLNMDDSPADVYPVVKKEGMTYPVLLAANTDVPRDYELDGIPCFIMIDQTGKVVQRYDGYAPQLPDAWEAKFQELTAAKTKTS